MALFLQCQRWVNLACLVFQIYFAIHTHINFSTLYKPNGIISINTQNTIDNITIQIATTIKLGCWGDRHILRAHDPTNWSLPLRQWHGEEWLEQQRFDHSAASHWGRTQTRALPGHPATRWHEGVQAARRISEASEHLIGSYGV